MRRLKIALGIAAVILIPLAELGLLVLIGSRIGVVPTTLLVIASGFLGGWLAKREGLEVLHQLQADLARGVPPATRIVEGVLVIVGALLLVVPGVLSDVVGLALVLPWTRRVLAPVVLRTLLRRFDVEVPPNMQFGGDSTAPPPPRPPPPPQSDSPFDHPAR